MECKAACGCYVEPTPLIPQIPPEDDEEKVTVRFTLDQYHVVAQVYTAVTTIFKVVQDLANKFKVYARFLKLNHDDIIEEGTLDVNLKLWELPRNEYGIIELNLGLNKLADQFNALAKRQSAKARLDLEVFYRYLILFLNSSIPSKM